jgi:hypothetical protein
MLDIITDPMTRMIAAFGMLLTPWAAISLNVFRGR